MPEETRQQQIERIIDNFLESSEKSIRLDLYSNEIRRAEKDYGEQLIIDKGRRTASTAYDKRYICIITKKRKLNK